MISFRFHVVSITAVFLAIAVGVVVGSTYVEGAVVDQLEARISTVEDRADEARAENDRLEGDLSTAREFIGLSADYAVTDRLVDVPVAVLATRGVDEGAVERMVVLARRAGAAVPGVIWLETRWNLEGDGDAEALREVVGGASGDSAAELWAQAWDGVAAELASVTPGDGGTAGEQPSTTGPALLTALQESGFVSVDALGDDTVTVADLGGAGARILVVTGARADEGLHDIVGTVLDSAVDADLATVVADVHVESQEGPARAELLTSLLDEQLRERLVLVDDADREEGRVAAVLALHGAASGEVGLHYGYGDGADAVLPAWTAP